MPATNEDKITSLVDRAALEGEFSFIQANMLQIRAFIKEFDKKIDIAKNMGFADVNKVAKDYNVTLAESQKATESLVKTQILQEKQSRANALAKKSETDATAALTKAQILEEKQAEATAKRLLAEERLRVANEKAAEKESIAIRKKNEEAAKQTVVANQVQQNISGSGLAAARAGAPVFDDSEELLKKAEAEREYNLALEEEIRNQAELDALHGRTPQSNPGIRKEIEDVKDLSDEYELQLNPLEEVTEARNKLVQTNKNLKADQLEDKALLKSGTIDRIEYNKRIIESNAAIEINKGKISTLNREIKAQAVLEDQSSGAVARLRAQLTLNTIAIERMTKAQERSAFGQTFITQTKALSLELDKQQSTIGNYTKNVGNYFSKAYSGLRILANILPGLGISGILLAVGTAIAYIAKQLNIFERDSQITTRSIKELGGVSAESKEQLQGMGETISEIGKKNIKDLESAISSINNKLSKTPGLMGQTVDTIKLLGVESDRLSDKLKKVEVTSFFKAITTEGFVKAIGAKIIQGELKEINKLIEDNQRLLEKYNTAQALENIQALSDAQDKIHIQNLKDEQELLKLQLNDAGTTYQKKTDLNKKIYEKQKEINTNAQFEELEAANGNEAKIAEVKAKYSSQNLLDYAKYIDEKKKLDLAYAEENRKAESNITERALQDSIGRNSKIANDSNEIAEIRIHALQLVLEAQEKLFAKQEADEIHAVEITDNNEARKKDIRDKYATLRTNSAQEESDKVFAILVAASIHELTLAEQTAAELKKIEFKQISPTDKGITNANQNEFADKIINDIKTANVELNKLAFSGDKFSQVLSHLIPLQAGEKIDEYVKKIKDIGKALKDLGKEAVGAIFDIFTNKIENQKNAIQDTIDRLDAQKEKEIEVANSTITNEQDKAAAIATINARVQAQKDLLAKKQRDLDIKKAQFDKGQAVASIIFNTAQGVTAALTSKPPNIILAAIVGAIGIVQAARVAAAPIPRYFRGIKSTPRDEIGIVGDGGRSEGLKFPDGTIMKTPAQATEMFLPKGTEVVADFAAMALKDTPYVNEHGKLVDPTAAIRRMEQNVVKAIKNKEEVHLYNIPYYKKMLQQGSSFRQYLDKHV